LALLRTMRMARIEVVAPADKTDFIIRDVGRLGIAHFINITQTKKRKYEELTEEFRHTSREDLLLQLSNRIHNTMKKLTSAPYPKPLPVGKDVDEVLKKIEGEIACLELEWAKIDNLMKEVTEEKASLEKDLTQFYEELEAVKKQLEEFGVSVHHLQALKKESLADRDKIRRLHERLLEAQKALALLEMAAKLSAPHEKLPNDEAELKKLREELRKALELHRRVEESLPAAKGEMDRIEEILQGTKEAVEKKIEAVEKFREVQAEVSQLKKLVEELEALNPEALALTGEAFTRVLRETVEVLDVLKDMHLGSLGIEDTMQKVSKISYEVLKSYEVLENAEKFLSLQTVKNLIDHVKEAESAEVEGLLEKARELLESTSMKHLGILEKALEIRHLEHRIDRLSQEPARLLERLEEVAKGASVIHAYREIVDIELRIEELKQNFRRTGKTAVFEVWVKNVDREKALEAIRRSCPEAVVNVTGEELGDKPPTFMKNPRIAACYEKLVAAFGLPNYHEIDPTIITLFSFPIIFGLMFGDMGQGLILIVGGLLIKKVFDRFKLSGDLWDPIYQGRFLIISCGITATFFGFLYGEFFGPTTAGHEYEWYTMLTGLKEGPWFSPIDPHKGGPVMLLKVALVVGMIHISFGIILDIINKLSRREFRKSLAPVSWLWFYLSLSYLMLSVLFFGQRIENILLDLQNIVPFFVVPFIGMFVLHRFSESAMDAFSEMVSKAIESISNTFSYGRILALGIAHAVFSEIALIGSGAMFWPVFIMVTIFMIIALEGIITFAHTLRLHWVEWFSKYYKGDGVPFEGFIIQRRFTAPA